MIALIVLAVSCTQTHELKWNEYRKWLSDAENGIVKQKKSRVINLSARYQPHEYLAFKDVAFDPQAMNEGLIKNYIGTVNFQLEIAAEENDANLLWYGLSDYPGYKQRINALSFHAQDLFKVTVAGKEYRPQFVHFEGYNELSKRLLFHVTFECPQWNEFDPKSKLRFSFEDPYWGSGLNHFTYNKKDLTDLPKLILG